MTKRHRQATKNASIQAECLLGVKKKAGKGKGKREGVEERERENGGDAMFDR
jgi:hypothetical protein